MKNKIILLVISGMICITTTAQNKFWENVKVRRAFETETANDDKAALLSFTFPKDKDKSYLFNGGIGYEFGKYGRDTSVRKYKFDYKHSFNGFFVYNRNTELDEEQKNYKLGLSFNQTWDYLKKKNIAIFSENAVEYMRDYYDTSHSLLVTSYWHPLVKRPKGLAIGGYKAVVGKKVLYYLLPQVGLEYQNVFTAKKEAEEGYNLRGYFSIGSSLLFRWKAYDPEDKMYYVKKGIEIKITYDGRLDIANNISGTESYIPLFKSEMIVYPTRSESFTIGLSYNDGTNPLDGLGKQTYWLLAFKFKK
jgi:hypothetical protein